MIYITALLFVGFSCSLAAQANKDYYQHYTAGMAINGAVSSFVKYTTKNNYKAVLSGFLVGVVAGDLKERYDLCKGKKYSSDDFLNTSFGSGWYTITFTIYLNDTKKHSLTK